MEGAVIQVRRNTSAQWADLNPILRAGQEGFESDTGRRKMGDGVSRWLELEYFLPESDIRALISSTPSGGGVSQEDLTAHIDSDTPHPVYDDGPSFLLLYENAKV